MNNFKDLRITDNFYQSSSFFPMPLTLIGTLDEEGKLTSFGAYSLVFPYYIAGKGYYAMVLECRNSSNTCKGLLRNGKCTINFLPHSKKNFKEHVRLGFPGDTPEEKMKDFKFHSVDGLSCKDNPNEVYPKVIEEAYQVFECTWVKELDNAQDDKVQDEYEGPYHDFNGITSKFGAHFILKIDKILMKKKYSDAIIRGVKSKDFPALPVDYGYRDSKNFWFHKKTRMRAELLQVRKTSLESVRYAADRIDDTVKFTDDALETILGVPRVFLKVVLQGCVDWAKENNVTLITAAEMKIINDKRSKEKNKK